MTNSRTLYYPYGGVRWPTGGSTLPTDYTFTRQRKDAYIDMIEMGARWYDPYLGRWASADTIVPDPANPQSLNRYSYSYNNPVLYVDKDGHNPIIGVMLIVAGVAMLDYVVPRISNYAEANDISFWEAAAQSDSYIDTREEIGVGIEAAMKVPEAVVGAYMLLTMGGAGLQQGGMSLDSTTLWNWGTAGQDYAARWGAFWLGGTSGLDSGPEEQ
ncbi:MAG: RHS repeat-associated core domain-containing protein [Chloroflexota bacterium]|nr:RHS repeat-associated core domain-containing protein [Chloroflexota bacterium]